MTLQHSTTCSTINRNNSECWCFISFLNYNEMKVNLITLSWLVTNKVIVINVTAHNTKLI